MVAAGLASFSPIVTLSCTPVVAVMREVDQEQEYVETYTADLRFNVTHHDHDYDLVECSPWDDVKVDTKVFVRDVHGERWYRRYFSHYADGKVHTFCSGCTSWSTVEEDDIGSEVDTVPWMEAKLAE